MRPYRVADRHMLIRVLTIDLFKINFDYYIFLANAQLGLAIENAPLRRAPAVASCSAELRLTSRACCREPESTD